jgi:hypothetical protein
MNREIVQDLTYSVLLRASRDRLCIGTTKLVKLLYLVDCEYYRWKRETLTGAPWIFYHFGPYCEEMIEVANATPGVVVAGEIELEDGKSFREYRVEEFRGDPIEKVHFSIRGPVESVYKRWAAVDLALLLDHVYFETAPMLTAERHRALDFSLIPNPKDAAKPEVARDFSKLIPADRRDALRKRLRASVEKYPVQRHPLTLQLDETDAAALLAMGDKD